MRAQKIKIRVIKKRSGIKKSAVLKSAPTFRLVRSKTPKASVDIRPIRGNAYNGINLRKSMRLFALKCVALILTIGMNWYGLSAIGTTVAYFNDTEISDGNAYGAGALDFALVSVSHAKSISLAEEISVSSVLINSGTLNWQYTLEAEKISGDDDFCNALELEAKLNGIEKYDGSLLSLDVSSLIALGTWKFNIEFPVDALGIAHGDTCNVDFVYKGWQKEVPLYEDSGFTDEERISINLTARMIVLNEFLPRPNGVAYGFDFGNDSSDMPQGEWVELYNNSDSSFNLAGWYIWDASGSEVNKIAVTAANTDLATTVIPARGWLVVYMNKAVLNNTGDTVKLYDGSNTLIDSHTYVSNDFCEIEPTPGYDNSTDVSGECIGVPPNKSYARIPDGIGEWVDPVPTPGGVNKIGDLLIIISDKISTVTIIGETVETTKIKEVEDISESTTENVTEETVITEEILSAEEPAAEIVIEETILPENNPPEETIIPNEEQPIVEAVEPEDAVDELPQPAEESTE